MRHQLQLTALCKGLVEGSVRYVKHNALKGRDEELLTFADYGRLAVYWRERVANVRRHRTTREKPLERFEKERHLLRPLPAVPHDTDELNTVLVTPSARVRFDANRYSVPPDLARKHVLLRADDRYVRVFHRGQESACHERCFDRHQILVLPEHRAAALARRKRSTARLLDQEFDALGPEARDFRLGPFTAPVKPTVHLRHILKLVRLYGKAEVLQALARALEFRTFDAAYVRNLVDQARRQRQLPSPLPLSPQRQDLIDEIQIDEPDPADYDELLDLPPEEECMSKPQKKLHEQLHRDLAALKLTRMAAIYQEVLDDAAAQGRSLLEAFAELVAHEATDRAEQALKRRIHRARLPAMKSLEDYDFNFPKRVPKQRILRLFDCDFVTQHGNAVLIGNQGTGKTHLITALGYVACQKGITVRFARAVDMVNDLTAGQRNGTLGKALRIYTNPSLLLLDELGYLPVDKRGADLMFQVVAARYETGSIVLTTNRVFKDWGAIFDVDNTLATALIDRLMHHGEAFVIQGKSYRMKDRTDLDSSADE